MEQQLQDTSNSDPLALGMLVVMACLTWSLPRRFAVCPLLIMTCLMPLGQQLDVFGLHFYLFRILLFVGVLRVVVKGEVRPLVMSPMDRIFVWWVIVSILFGTMANPSLDLFRNRLGEAYNAVGCYFFVRCVIVDFEDIVTSVRTLAWLSLGVALLMLVEKTTSHNLLSVFGGVSPITAVREGHLRCQGAFRHPILAGTFGAAQFPLFVALWYYRPAYRRLATVAAISSVIVALTASSSGALMALLAAIAGLAFWTGRNYMRAIRRGAVLIILSFALVMNAPVWYLFDRLSSLTGGTGWHRAFLIDQAIGHFNEWWLFGTTYTAHWGPSGEVIPGDPNMMDITNHFIVQGVSGGLLKLLLFISLLVAAFRSIGRRLRAEGSSPEAFFVWALGVALFAHCASFMSVSYFDQMIIVFYWLLAAICCIACNKNGVAWRAEAESCPTAIAA
jgi:hypothetical protein